MQQLSKSITPPNIRVEVIEKFKDNDLSDLCTATENTILDNNLSFSTGMNRTNPLIRERLEAYWQGLLLVPNRILIVGRIDNVIAAAIQLELPSRNNQTQAFSATLDHHFVAPWARGFGLAKSLIFAAEEEARKSNISLLKLSVRANLETAIHMYESCQYKRWGTLDKYEIVDGKTLAGHFYYKDL